MLGGIKALRHLASKQEEKNEEFVRKTSELELKYHSLYEPLCQKRSQIIKGTYEPTEEECDYESESDEEEEEEDYDSDCHDGLSASDIRSQVGIEEDQVG